MTLLLFLGGAAGEPPVIDPDDGSATSELLYNLDNRRWYDLDAAVTYQLDNREEYIQ